MGAARAIGGGEEKYPERVGQPVCQVVSLNVMISVSEFGVHLMIKFESEYVFSGFDSLSAITLFYFFDEHVLFGLPFC